ncbi:alpha/beta hydrolase [Corynebacterium ulceribovis]|uniref:alpha/beta hydrolase n=1 Tax=Corynebacterium ulceribovis TaxID=487732 RepID=UPI0003681AB2|nr:alpha/beta hydrolase-fold protein [Corynebacterium ulceribovis]
MLDLRNIPLTDRTALFVIVVLLLFTTATGLFGLRHRQLVARTLLTVLMALLVTSAVWLTVEILWKPFPDAIPPGVYASAAAAVFAIGCILSQRGRRITMTAMSVIALTGAAAAANTVYQQYPTIGSFNPAPASVTMTYDQFQVTTAAPRLDGREVGAMVTIPMTGTVSGFPARDAVAYIPPAYFTQPKLRLPVLLLLAGNPGEPKQWFGAGYAEHTADQYQAAHNGVSPIVISVDGTGSLSGNPICVDGPQLKVQTYLANDVPALIKEKLRVNEDQRTWTIGGLSYGGTCALQIVTNAPQAYGNFLNFSGQAEPTLGNHKQTVDKFFGGDEAAFQAVNPATLLKQNATQGTNKYVGIQGKFYAGSNDKNSTKDLTALNDAANKSGMTTTFHTVPGGHSFQVWRVALLETLGWAAQRGGLP